MEPNLDFLDSVQSFEYSDASRQALNTGDGIGAATIQNRNRKNPKYKRALHEAATFMTQVYKGRRRPQHLYQALNGQRQVLSESHSTDDFKILFSDILDRQLLSNYREVPISWNQYIRRNVVQDFREVKRYFVDGANTTLDPVGENGEYPETFLSDGQYKYRVQKFGRRLPLSWETMVNDDLGALRDIPQRFGAAATSTEELIATQIYCDANGPKTTIFNTGTHNVVPGNPPLSVLALQRAFTEMTRQRDVNNRPIIITNVILVVPPTLTFVAENIISDGTIQIGADSGQIRQTIPNWLKNRVRVVTNWYLPVVVTAGTVGETCWFLFGDPNNGRPAIELGFLAGHEEPEIFMKEPNSRRVGGGILAPMEGDFDTDSIQYKVRHILGGAPLDPKMMMSSSGQGSAVTTYP